MGFDGRNGMRRSFLFLALLLIPLMTGCYSSATSQVVDAEAGDPIKGAIALVEWTITGGMIGLTSTKPYKVIEAVTDKDGNTTISGEFNPSVNTPHVTVYKKGYVTWNDAYIFPDYKHRKDFDYKNGKVMKLERFKPQYAHWDHDKFFHGRISSAMNDGAKRKNREAFRWEDLLASEEMTRIQIMEERRKPARKTEQ